MKNRFIELVKFSASIGCVLVLFVILLTAMHHALSHEVFKRDFYRAKNLSVVEGHIIPRLVGMHEVEKPYLLFVGTSSTRESVDVNIIENAFEGQYRVAVIAGGGVNNLYHEILLDGISDFKQPPKAIFIGLNSQSLRKVNLEPVSVFDLSKALEADLGFKDRYLALSRELRNIKTLVNYYLIKLQSVTSTFDWVLTNASNDPFKSYVKRSRYRGHIEEMRERYIYGSMKRSGYFDPATYEYAADFESLETRVYLEPLKAIRSKFKDTLIYLVKMPEHSVFQRRIPDASDELFLRLVDASRPLITGMIDASMLLNDDVFYDHAHVNEAGRDLFSRAFVGLLKRDEKL